MIIIKTLHFEDYEDFAYEVSDVYDRVKSNDKYDSVDVVAKYEDIQMIDLEDKVDDIISIYINKLYHTDKTVGVIVNKEIAEYILDNLIRLD